MDQPTSGTKPDDAGKAEPERGLLGNFIGASLGAQFEAMSCDWLNLSLQDPRITGSNDPITGTNDPAHELVRLAAQIWRHDPAAGITGVRHYAGRRLYVPAEPLGDPLSGIADNVSNLNRPKVVRRPLLRRD